eukprot:TRINITY_DN297_c0_g1_i5.p1 TRINITY_DN297_c0_g1~~TRINITY_DN297_c0_g1_i5.p1  ORF type:complete len:513 (-),score=67.44 TRINITY_DN297_c0_g1_i5:282-1820(-)
MPIIFDFFNCYPVDDITISVSFSPADLIQLDQTFMVKTLDSDSTNSGKIIFVVNETTGVTLVPGQEITLSFTVSGTNAASFDQPDDVTVIAVDPISGTYTFDPIAQSISGSSQITVSENVATVEFQCDQPSIMYWALGVSPSITSVTQSTISNKLVSSSGVLSNYTEKEDYTYWRVYGLEIISVATSLTKTFTGLKSDSEYQVKYYCVNQMKLVSDPASGEFDIPDNGGYFMKLTLSFTEELTYEQNDQLACAIDKLFQLSKSRVYTQFASICGSTSTSIFVEDQDTSQAFSVSQSDDNLYQYMFYIIPDYSLATDDINQDILESLSSQDFNSTLLDKTSDSSSFSVLQEFQSEEILVDQVPTVSLTYLYVGVDLVSVTAQLLNYKGYIIVGIYKGTLTQLSDGSYDLNPTPLLMKKGYCDESMQLLQVQYTYSEAGVTKQFGFDGLEQEVEYALIIMATNDDSSHLATAGNYIIKQFKTNKPEIVVITYGQILFGYHTFIIMCIILLAVLI